MDDRAGADLSPADRRLFVQYSVAAPRGLPARITHFQRRRMFRAFLDFAQPVPSDKIIDIGVTSDRDYEHSNYFEAWYGRAENITAIGLEDASFLRQRHPRICFVRANGCELPFGDGSFEYAHSSAVLEHVGSGARQAGFLREAWRVCRKGLFVTTPNRWFPIEFHTLLPLLHWLPVGLHRKLLTRLGKEFFGSEDNLNLLSRRSLAGTAKAAGIAKHSIETVGLLGWPTNLILQARKEERMQ